MRIEYNKATGWHYYDMKGQEIHDGDTVMINGRKQRVYLTEQGCLGTDATNPKWIESGRAFETEYGIYPFADSDEPTIIKEV